MTMIDLSAARTARVQAAAQDAGQWLKVRDHTGRALAYGVPSATTPGLYHFANSRECTCPAGQRGRRCWHATAVAMHVAAVRAQQCAEANAAKYDAIFGGN